MTFDYFIPFINMCAIGKATLILKWMEYYYSPKWA